MCKRVSEWNEFWQVHSCPSLISNLTPHHHICKRMSAWNLSIICKTTCWISFLHSLIIIGGAAPAGGEWIWRPLHHQCWPELPTHTRFDGSINDAYQLVLAAIFIWPPTQLNSLNLLDLTPWLDTGPSTLILPFPSAMSTWWWSNEHSMHNRIRKQLDLTICPQFPSAMSTWLMIS